MARWPVAAGGERTRRSAPGVPALAAGGRRRRGLRLTMFDVGQGESLLVESGGWRALVDTGRPAVWRRHRHRAPRRGAGALGARRDVARRAADHPPGSRTTWAAPAPCSTRMPVRELWLGVDVPGHEPSQAAAARGPRPNGARVIERRAGERSRRAGVAHPRAASTAARLGTAPRAQRRLGGARGRPRRCGGAADGRRERRRRARDPAAADAGARARPEGGAPRQPHVHVGGARATAGGRDVALVSCGRGNSFGHPAPAVLARLRAAGRHRLPHRRRRSDHGAERRPSGVGGDVSRPPGVGSSCA